MEPLFIYWLLSMRERESISVPRMLVCRARSSTDLTRRLWFLTPFCYIATAVTPWRLVHGLLGSSLRGGLMEGNAWTVA